jgi:hypothetical protein
MDGNDCLGRIHDGWLSDEDDNQELAREAVGLWICSAALILFYSLAPKK